MSPTTTDQRFFTALRTADASALDELLTDDFLLVDVMAGGVIDRTALIGVVASGEMAFDAIDPQSPPSVRRYGQTAVIVGETRMTGRFATQQWAAHSRYTHVFVRSGGSPWRLASAQGTPIVDAGDGSPAATAPARTGTRSGTAVVRP